MRLFLLLLVPAVALADTTPPVDRPARARCITRMQTARAEFFAGLPEWGEVQQRDAHTIGFLTGLGDDEETDEYLEATFTWDPRMTASSGWRVRRHVEIEQGMHVHHETWTREAAGRRAAIERTCIAMPCYEPSRMDDFLRLFRAALDGCF
jgi:hypothetical protein